MACRTLELTLLSASDLRVVNLVSKMEVYAVVYLAGDPRARQRVATDRAGGRNPSWRDATVRLAVPASGAGSGALRVLLRAERAGLGGDRDVGEVVVPLPGILAGAGDGPTASALASYPVRKVGSSKTTHGVLNLSYKLGGVVHPDPAASCSCKAIAKAAGDTTTAYLAAAYMAAPPPLYGYRQPPAIPQPGRPMGAMAAPDKNGVLHCP
ncbi:protein SRC2-like [Oryza brachyantha]|uniref:protein SRC2-like n=1 Tax=Oryza brachyantha TaxID=4533 RepID=UPI001ADBCE71|nr:protein SRC2-like [Oryza brachyantha]